MTKLSLGLFVGFCLLYAIFSFSLTDPNLVISSWAPYWQFQQWMWQTFFLESHRLTYTFTLLVSGLFLSYLGILSVLATKPAHHSPRWVLLSLVAGVAVLFLSYNALSHDVFNYMFNAKMVMYYQTDPHTQVALNFPQDEWLRFMHNTHTPAPYGEGWTALSLFPYLLGGEKFIVTWLNFRVLSVLSLGALLSVLWQALGKQQLGKKTWLMALLVFNPLLLIEVVSNSHNDLWMMFPAVLALVLTVGELPKKKLDISYKFILTAVLLGLSVTVKLATIVLIPVWLGLWLMVLFPKSRWSTFGPSIWLRLNWPLVTSILMFLPLMTGRSQLFHPWYLIWPLVWLPLFNWKSKLAQIWGILLLGFSLSSLLRYLPWLWAGDFAGQVLLHQQLITWIGGILIAAILFSTRKKFLINLR